MNARQTIRQMLAARRERREIAALRRQQMDIINDPRRNAYCADFSLTEQQLAELDSFWQENYGRKIDPECHRQYAAYSGVFDPQCVPEQVYIPEVERFLNLATAYCDTFSDKNVTPYLAAAAGVRVPRTIVRRVAGMLQDPAGRTITPAEAARLIAAEGRAFIKPAVGTGGGSGCKMLQMLPPPTQDTVFKQLNGSSRCAEQVAREALDEYCDCLDYVVQECVTCHESLRAIYPGSVNTFRVMTFRWHDDIHVAPVSLRMGRGGSVVDNACAGGIFIGVNADGTLLPQSVSTSGEHHTSHPDTGLLFAGHRIDCFKRVTEAALRLHAAIPQVGAAHWDLSLDTSGTPVLIEANTQFGDIGIVEKAHGHSAFGSLTAEVLRWTHLMSRLPPAERQRHLYGK